MTSARVPVDLRNPGQVFACLGLMEATEILCGPCDGRFEYTGSETLSTFCISTADDADPVAEVLEFLESAGVQALSPDPTVLSAAKWGVDTTKPPSSSYPFDPPNTPATLAVLLSDDRGRSIPISHWGDSPKSGRDNVKFWAGSGGYPGAALARDALELVRGDGVPEPLASVSRDPFNLGSPQSSSFRFDWRRDYVPLDVGFSPNEHGNVSMVGFPIVEILAAIGLEHARPMRPARNNKLLYRYGVSNAPLPVVFARAVLGLQSLNFPMRTFQMRLGWPGQEGQARCIIDAREENEA